jgi:hypothetical protein
MKKISIIVVSRRHYFISSWLCLECAKIDEDVN